METDGGTNAKTNDCIQITAGKNDAGANFIMRWPDPSRGTMTSKPASMSNSYAEQHTTTNAQDDMPLIWPVLTPTDLRVAGPQLASAGEPQGMLAILAGALAFAALMALSIFKRRPHVRLMPASRTTRIMPSKKVRANRFGAQP
jgi:hypothetical protein